MDGSVWSASPGKVGKLVAMSVTVAKETYELKSLGNFLRTLQLLAFVCEVHRGAIFTANNEGPRKFGNMRTGIRLPMISFPLLTKLALGCSKQVLMKSIYPQ